MWRLSNSSGVAEGVFTKKRKCSRLAHMGLETLKITVCTSSHNAVGMVRWTVSGEYPSPFKG